MHMSLVPTLHGVPSNTESPHGTITVSSVSVQYSSQGSATQKQYRNFNYMYICQFCMQITNCEEDKSKIISSNKQYTITVYTTQYLTEVLSYYFHQW